MPATAASDFLYSTDPNTWHDVTNYMKDAVSRIQYRGDESGNVVGTAEFIKKQFLSRHHPFGALQRQFAISNQKPPIRNESLTCLYNTNVKHVIDSPHAALAWTVSSDCLGLHNHNQVASGVEDIVRFALQLARMSNALYSRDPMTRSVQYEEIACKRPKTMYFIVATFADGRTFETTFFMDQYVGEYWSDFFNMLYDEQMSCSAYFVVEHKLFLDDQERGPTLGRVWKYTDNPEVSIVSDFFDPAQRIVDAMYYELDIDVLWNALRPGSDKNLESSTVLCTESGGFKFPEDVRDELKVMGDSMSARSSDQWNQM
ncbi:hypothetical protein K474DRAFT_1774134 [Panus rudis PR-1116 ss-1]|nr:hypothetical protein K474DRAFT_1774134 [Panus rudis PR-1116 ss-1]